MVSTVGSGILVGTALVVIVPEGVETVYGAVRESGTSSGEGDSSRGPIGMALLAGFVLMYIIDRAPLIVSRRGDKGPTTIDMMEMRFRPVSQDAAGDVEAAALDEIASAPPPAGAGRSSGKRTAEETATSTSIGLWIHAVADGVALGASISSENAALGLFVFVAILIHKAPAAFGLSSVLQNSGVSSWRVKRDLAVFAAAAPVGAIITYGIVLLLGAAEPALVQWWAGILLVFSGGTFLFVAMHVMENLGSAEAQERPTTDVLLTSVGMLIPLVSLFVPDI